MKKRKFFLLIIIFILICSSGACFAWHGKVISVIDGDTFKVLRGNESVKIRLYGIDTPEIKQVYGKEAKQFIEYILSAGQPIEIQEINKDRYGRTVGIVFVSGRAESVNAELVKFGLAWVYKRYCKDKPLCLKWLKYEARAKKAGLGLFNDRKAVHPSVWRRAGANKRWDG